MTEYWPTGIRRSVGGQILGVSQLPGPSTITHSHEDEGHTPGMAACWAGRRPDPSALTVLDCLAPSFHERQFRTNICRVSTTVIMGSLLYH